MEDLFDLKGVDGGKPIEKMHILEERITRIIKVIKNLREEKSVLEAKVAAMEEDLTKKKEELNRIKHQMEDVEKVQGELASLSEERGLIRTRIEGILREIESIELS